MDAELSALKPLYVLAVDPGKSTGWVLALVSQNDLVVLEYGQEIEDVRDTIDRVRAKVEEITSTPDTNLVVVTERFVVRTGAGFFPDVTPLKINATLDYLYAPGGRVHLRTQLPSQAKALVSNDSLKRLGYYPFLMGSKIGQPDADDVRDAFRHLIYFGVKSLGLKGLSSRLAG